MPCRCLRCDGFSFSSPRALHWVPKSVYLDLAYALHMLNTRFVLSGYQIGGLAGFKAYSIRLSFFGASRFDFRGVPPEISPIPGGWPRSMLEVFGQQNASFERVFSGFVEIAGRHWTSSKIYGVGTAGHRTLSLSICFQGNSIFQPR